MPSYQEVEQRLKVVEDKINFVMNTIQLTTVVATGLFDNQGQPVGDRKQMSLLQMYHMANDIQIREAATEKRLVQGVD
jgi:hypothetical protein